MAPKSDGVVTLSGVRRVGEVDATGGDDRSAVPPQAGCFDRTLTSARGETNKNPGIRCPIVCLLSLDHRPGKG